MAIESRSALLAVARRGVDAGIPARCCTSGLIVDVGAEVGAEVTVCLLSGLEASALGRSCPSCSRYCCGCPSESAP